MRIGARFAASVDRRFPMQGRDVMGFLGGRAVAVRRRGGTSGSGRRRRTLWVEALEDRQLLSTTSSAVPDLALISAQALDSRSVTVAYDVLGGDIDRSFDIGLFRSADSQYGSEDIPSGSVRIVAPGQGEITRDDQGRRATAQ